MDKTNKTNQFRTTITKKQHNNTSRLSQSSKTQLDYVKLIKSIKLQDDLKKIKQFKALQQSIKREKQEVTEIEMELSKVQQKIIQKKQQVIKKKLQNIQQNKKQRQKFIFFTNKELSKVKKTQQEKNKIYENIIREQQERKRQQYQRRMKQRVNVYRNPINFDEIKNHQKKYLELRKSCIQQKERFSESRSIKRSLRVKSQADSRHQNEFQKLSIDPKSMLNERIKDQYEQMRTKKNKRRQLLLKMIQKRNQYGNRVELEMKNNKVKTQPSEYFQRSKIFSTDTLKQRVVIKKKSHVDSNLPKISINDLINKSLRKIQEDKLTNVLQKFQKIKSIENMYNNKTSPQSVDLLTQLTLVKADLFLKI